MFILTSPWWKFELFPSGKFSWGDALFIFARQPIIELDLWPCNLSNQFHSKIVILSNHIWRISNICRNGNHFPWRGVHFKMWRLLHWLSANICINWRKRRRRRESWWRYRKALQHRKECCQTCQSLDWLLFWLGMQWCRARYKWVRSAHSLWLWWSLQIRNIPLFYPLSRRVRSLYQYWLNKFLGIPALLFADLDWTTATKFFHSIGTKEHSTLWGWVLCLKQPRRRLRTFPLLS